MITKLYIADGNTWSELPVYNRVEFDERLDEQLDSGQVQTINGIETAYEDYSLFRMSTIDAEGVSKNALYYGFDTVEKRGKEYYIHTIELVEITRIVMGISIDGCKVTQSIDGTKKTLYEVLTGLLNKVKLKSATRLETYLSVSSANEAVKKMKEVASPEFHWECGTLLWECLCDIGKVIDCIPRASVSISTGIISVQFDQINNVTQVYEL